MMICSVELHKNALLSDRWLVIDILDLLVRVVCELCMLH